MPNCDMRMSRIGKCACKHGFVAVARHYSEKQESLSVIVLCAAQGKVLAKLCYQRKTKGDLQINVIPMKGGAPLKLGIHMQREVQVDLIRRVVVLSAW